MENFAQDIFIRQNRINSVAIIAKRHIGENRELIMLKEYAQNAAAPLQSADTAIQSTVSVAEVVSVEADGIEDVYNMEVEDNHNFAINGGYIVHNCMDSLRYLLYTVVRKDLRSDEDEYYDIEV